MDWVKPTRYHTFFNSSRPQIQAAVEIKILLGPTASIQGNTVAKAAFRSVGALGPKLNGAP